MSELRVTLLGPFAARDGPRPLPTPVLRKAQDLLALLFLAPGHTLLRETVTETLWPEAGSESSRKSMRQALWQVHRAADATDGVRLVVGDGDAVRINGDRAVWVDVVEFTDAVRIAQEADRRAIDDDRLAALAGAADLYRGPLHVGCLDEWCLVPRARLEDRCLTLLDRLSREHERRGDLDAAVGWTQRLLEIEPAHERSHRRLMRLYYEAGDRTRALRQLRQCRAVLESELGVRPAASTEALGATILADAGPVRDDDVRGRAWAEDAALAAMRAELAALRRSVEVIGERLRPPG
ncbi:MAG: AfsR/SARP family transcriptional regulator [Georgenia sp.]